MGPADFLEQLWGPAPPGLIQIWELQGKRSTYYKAPAGTVGLAGRTDIYTGVATAHKNHGATKRAGNEQALAIPGLWLDLDVNGGPDQKTGAIADFAAAVTLSHALLPPTLVISSGYGVHAWYLFDQPWRFTSRDEQDQAAKASAQFYALHRKICADHGWGLDHTHDLARLLRLPGTLNGKGGHRQPVEPVFTSGPRTPRADLLALAATAGDIPVRGGSAQLQMAGELAAITASPANEAPDLKLQALIENVAEFAATWEHDLGARAAGWSLSEYDLSLCTQAVAAGWNDQELAGLIAAHRRRWDPAGEKAGRLKYVQGTILRARTPTERQSAMDVLRSSLGRAA